MWIEKRKGGGRGEVLLNLSGTIRDFFGFAN